MEHKTIKGVGGEVHYWISRPESAPEGAIVFTHGLTANHTMYEKQVAHFKEKYIVIVWDVPMHGLSMPYAPFSYENTARDLNTILEQEDIEKVSLAGMSMGGYPSQMFAHLYPEKAQCIIGIDTTPFGTAYYSKSDLFWLSKVKPIGKLIPEKLLRESMAKSISATDYSYQTMKQILAPVTKAQILDQMDIAYGKFALENKDLDLKCPILILLGDKDHTGKVRQYSKMWAEKTGHPLCIIKNASHFSNGDNPEQVNREIEKFINQTK